MSGPAWERVDVLDIDVPDNPVLPGRLDLVDGRRLIIPGEAGQIDSESAERHRIVQRRFDMMRNLRIARPNIRIDGDHVIAVAWQYKWHPLDTAIVRAMGYDVDAAHRAYREHPVWWSGDPPDTRTPNEFYSTMGGRLCCSVELMDRILYDELRISIDRDLPETIVTNLVGRQLSEVVGLPQLVGVDAPITFCDVKKNPFAPGMRTTLWVGDDNDWQFLD